MLKLEYLNYDSKEIVPTVDLIYGDMQRNIIEEILFPGYKITEQNLCKKYSVSRTPIREVLRRLEEDGLIEIIQNRGAFVTGLDRNGYLDLLEERKYCEVLATRLSILRIKNTELELLDETFEFMQFYYGQKDYSKLAKIFKGFHQIIYYSTYNSRLNKELNFFYTCSNRKHGLEKFYVQQLDEIYMYYTSIYESFKNRQVQTATETMSKLLDLYIIDQKKNA